MSIAANDLAYKEKIRTLAKRYPERLSSEAHEAHHLMEIGEISKEAYEEIYAFCLKHGVSQN